MLAIIFVCLVFVVATSEDVWELIPSLNLHKAAPTAYVNELNGNALNWFAIKSILRIIHNISATDSEFMSAF